MKIVASVSIELKVQDTEMLDEAKERAIDTLIDSLEEWINNNGIPPIISLEYKLPEETMMRVFSLRKSPGMVLISSDDISKAEVEEVEKFTTDFEVGKTKTASQRLRAVLYRVWEQSEQAYDFPIWYESQMERIINKYKTTLEQ